jgi:hypothetical protein
LVRIFSIDLVIGIRDQSTSFLTAVVELSSDEEGSDNDDLSDHSSDNGVSRLSIGSDISELEDEEAQERELALSSSKKVTEIVFKTPDEFKRRREEFSLLAYKDINKRAFGGKLPSIPLRWRKTKAIVGLFVSVRPLRSLFVYLVSYLTHRDLFCVRGSWMVSESSTLRYLATI